MSTEITEMSPELQAILSRLAPEERAILTAEIAKKKPRAKTAPKELPAELIAAQADLDKFVAENKDFISHYEGLKSKVASFKKTVRVKLATRQYKFTPETGDPGIYDKETGQVICIFKEKDWQEQFLGAGYTHGQVQAIYKAMSLLKKKGIPTPV